jgi:DNA-binding transcriptional regulator YiaG
MRASWRAIKNRTMTKGQQARAHALAMRDLRGVELRGLREALQITQVALAKKLKPMAVRSGKKVHHTATGPESGR